MIGGFDLVLLSEKDLGKLLDWAMGKFPIRSEWDQIEGIHSLSFYLPGHTDHQGIIQIICEDEPVRRWTAVIDVEFKEELLDYLESN